jgi:hypothetical protein
VHAAAAAVLVAAGRVPAKVAPVVRALVEAVQVCVCALACVLSPLFLSL